LVSEEREQKNEGCGGGSQGETKIRNRRESIARSRTERLRKQEVAGGKPARASHAKGNEKKGFLLRDYKTRLHSTREIWNRLGAKKENYSVMPAWSFILEGSGFSLNTST